MGKGKKRAIDGNISVGGMKGDKSSVVGAKKEENGNAAVLRKRGKKKNVNEDNYVELHEGRRDKGGVEKKVEEGKDNLNTVKDERGDVQSDEDTELSSSVTGSEESDQDDGNYNHHLTHNAFFHPMINYCSFAPWNLTVFTLDQN